MPFLVENIVSPYAELDGKATSSSKLSDKDLNFSRI